VKELSAVRSAGREPAGRGRRMTDNGQVTGGARRLTPTALIAILTALLTALLMVPPVAPAAARTAITYRVAGAEIFATPTEGVFVGTASRSQGVAGTWYADVLHEPLDPHGAIEGGSFGMLLGSAPHVITGEFRSGQVRQLVAGRNCTDQRYSVTGRLRPVTAGSGTTAGAFSVLLTHYRTRVLGRCVTYGATVGGSVTIA